MQKYSLDVIGTHLDIYIDTTEDTSSIFENIGIRLQNFEKKYSRFLEGNWLSDINMTRQGILDIDARNMIEYALIVAQSTNGYFDPTIGKRLTELGYGRQWIMNNEQWAMLGKWFWNYKDIEIAWDSVILQGNIELEFGGVGKWYLIDVIKGVLEKYPRFLINFGGDMYGKGIWNVGLESPFASDEIIGTISLDDLFLACSAGTKRKWGAHHHLIDPHTGASATEVVATYIEGKSGISVDSYATALSVMPWDMAREVFQKTPEISGVIVSKEGNIFQKEGSRAEVFE